MPFINGRYYVNPIMGEALEAAREAEAALAALENRGRQNSDARDGEPGNESGRESNGAATAPGADGNGPIHRVEIEAAELVPSHSGRAARGYVARVHRQPAAIATQNRTAGFVPRAAGGSGNRETHVFADHRDLVSFLRDELARDSHSRSATNQST
jgi:hypothetical protein